MHRRYRWIIYALIIFYFPVANSQVIVKGRIKDGKTGENLSYCSVAIKNTEIGALSNSEGIFLINADSGRDTLVFHFLGYQKLQVPVSMISGNKTVYLYKKEILLKEFIVHADDDYLFEILSKCRKTLLKNRGKQVTRLYYGIQTASKGVPVEMVECYYNAYMDGCSIDSLLLKNGRLGLGAMDQRYFLTLNTSRAIGKITVTEKSEYNPAIPLQFNKREAGKLFNLKMIYADDLSYNIGFTPVTDDKQSFTGDLWIDKNTYALQMINLRIENAAVYPFLPLFSCDRIDSIGIYVTQTYKEMERNIYLDHVNFSYKMKYSSVRDTPTVKERSIIDRDIETRGLLYFYDYDHPFIPPYFNYDPAYDDYRKISIIPYNEDFWDHNEAILLTEAQKNELGYFSKSGQLINYREGNYGKDFLDDTEYDTAVFEYYYTFWAPGRRIILDRQLAQNNVNTTQNINSGLMGFMYNLVVQILLDINESDGKYLCRSYTVFDAKNTFYHLPDAPNTKAFLNIYFDLWEIERRNMQQDLEKHSYTLDQINSLYSSTVERATAITKKYLKEVQTGKDANAMKKWNKLVYEALQIDNLELR